MSRPTLGHAGAPALGLKHHIATLQYPLPRQGSAVPPSTAMGWMQHPWCSLSPMPLADGNEILVDGAEAGPLVGVILPAALHQLVHLLRALLGGVQPHTWGNRDGDMNHWPLTPHNPAWPIPWAQLHSAGPTAHSHSQEPAPAVSPTMLHCFPCLLIAEVGIGDGTQAEGFPQQDPKAPDITL